MFFWFVLSPENLKANMERRGAERDHHKLLNDQAWQKYINSVDFSFRPVFEHVTIETTDKSVEQTVSEVETAISPSARTLIY